MSDDPCTTSVLWSAITAAQLDSTVAGVLAGLLIAAAAALLVQSYQGSDAHTIALFGSGVPALALSTYLFTVIAGLNLPKQPDQPKERDIEYLTPGGRGDTLCSQLWSEWILAIGSLFIGGAVLVCGLAWALVSYADNVAVKICPGKIPTEASELETVQHRRGLFIQLSGWLSCAAITAATALLISANVTYLTAIRKRELYWSLFGEKWYLLFVVYLLGLYVIGCSSYAVFRRTRSALRANTQSCAAYARAEHPPAAQDPRSARRKEIVMQAARDFAAATGLALAAFLAIHMASGDAFNNKQPNIAVSPTIIIQVVVLYIIARTAYPRVMDIIKTLSARKADILINNDVFPVGKKESEDPIRIKYSAGRLAVTTCSAVVLAVSGTFFVVWLTQGPLWEGPRIATSLLLGGLGPALVLNALSNSVPAAETPGRRGRVMKTMRQREEVAA
ncbi:MAG TPA: hypothetical protein VGI68_07440 [Mycobacterium sp.]